MILAEPIPDLSALDLLVTVAEKGSINEAAAAHSISQPAASMRLRTLERVLGLQLLERAPTGSRMTPAGAATVEWARSVLHGMRSLVASADALRSEARPHLQVAASLTVAEYLMPTWLRHLVAIVPAAVVNVQMGNSVTVRDLVAEGRAEIGFVEGTSSPESMQTSDLGEDDLVVVVSPAHPWARRRLVRANEVARTKLLLREVGSGTRDVLTEALARHGLTVQPLVEFASTTAIKDAACAGSGPAVLSYLAVAEEVGAGRLVVVRCPELELTRHIRAIWTVTKLSEPAAELLAVASDNRRAAR